MKKSLLAAGIVYLGLFQPAFAQISTTPVKQPPSSSGPVSKSAFMNMAAPGKIKADIEPSIRSERTVVPAATAGAATETQEYNSQNLGFGLFYGLPRSSSGSPQFEVGASSSYNTTTITYTSTRLSSGINDTSRDEYKGLTDISLTGQVAVPATSEINILGGLSARFSPESAKTEITEKSDDSKSNNFSGGQSVGADVGLEFHPAGTRNTFGTLASIRYMGESKREVNMDGNDYSTSTRSGYDRQMIIAFAERQLKLARVGVSAGMLQVGGSHRDTQFTGGTSSTRHFLSFRENIASLYAGITASDNLVLRPTVSYRETNDPRHLGYDYDQSFSFELGASASF